MIIRRSKNEDINKIVDLEKKWKREGISWGIRTSTLKERLKEFKENVFFVVEKDGKILGYIEGGIIKAQKKSFAFEIKKGEKYGELLTIYIDKKFRNMRFGEKLINRLINYFKSKKITKIRLKAVNKDLIRLIKFYNNFGFKERTAEMMLELK